MSETKLNKHGYMAVIEDDINFLKRNLPDELYNCSSCKHIILVLKASVTLLYG